MALQRTFSQFRIKVSIVSRIHRSGAQADLIASGASDNISRSAKTALTCIFEWKKAESLILGL